MSVPASRKSSSKARRGRAHLALKKIKLNKCKKCGKAVKPHTVCSFCGAYKGKQAINIKIKKAKKETKK